MSTLQIQLRDDLEQQLSAKAAKEGYGNLVEFVEAVLEAQCDDEEYDEELENLLIQRLDDGPSIPVTPEFIQKLKDDVAERLKR
jgi:hypothetical protein